MVCRIQRLAVGLGVRGDDRRILRSAPAEEGVALAGRLAQSNVIVYQIVTVGGHVLDFVVRPGIKRDALERHGAVEMVSVDLAVGFVALVCGIGHELQRVLAVPANAVQHALVELFGIDLAVERELAIVNLVCHACNVGLRGHQLAEGDELAACVEAFREAKTRKRRNGLRIALGKSNALVGRLHIDIDGLFHILQLAIELPILGIIECLGALAGVAEVLRILIPAVKLVAVFFDGLGLEVRAEAVFRNVDRFAVRFDLVAVLVIDGVGDGMIPVGIDGQVASRASRNLGDLLSNAVLVQIAAPLQEGLAEHALVRNGVQRDSLLDRVRLSVFGIKILILNVLVAVVVRNRVLDGCEVAVENPRLVKELCDFGLLADVFGLLVPAGELVAGLFGRRPERVILAASNRNVFLVCVHPFAVFVLQPVRDMEGVLLPDSVEDIVRIARGAHPAICSQVFHGEGWVIGVAVGRPAEELVALADGNIPAELELHNSRTRLKGLRLRLGQVRHRLARRCIRVVGQGDAGRIGSLFTVNRNICTLLLTFYSNDLPFAEFAVRRIGKCDGHGVSLCRMWAVIPHIDLIEVVNIRCSSDFYRIGSVGIFHRTVLNERTLDVVGSVAAHLVGSVRGIVHVIAAVDACNAETARAQSRVGRRFRAAAGCRLDKSINIERPASAVASPACSFPLAVFPLPSDAHRVDLKVGSRLAQLVVAMFEIVVHLIRNKLDRIGIRIACLHLAIHIAKDRTIMCGASRRSTVDRKIMCLAQSSRLAGGCRAATAVSELCRYSSISVRFPRTIRSTPRPCDIVTSVALIKLVATNVFINIIAQSKRSTRSKLSCSLGSICRINSYSPQVVYCLRARHVARRAGKHNGSARRGLAIGLIRVDRVVISVTRAVSYGLIVFCIIQIGIHVLRKYRHRQRAKEHDQRQKSR